MIGPMVAAILLGAIIVGYVVYKNSSRRDARWLLAISERVADQDEDGAKALADRWERRAVRAGPIRRLRVAQGWANAGDHRRALAILDGIPLPQGRTGLPLRRLATGLRFASLQALGRSEEAQAVVERTIEEDPAAPWLSMAAPTDPRITARKPSSVVRAENARDAFSDRRFGEAADSLEAVLRGAATNPMSAAMFAPQGYLVLASTQLAAGQDAAAEASFREFVRRSLDRDAAERRVPEARAAGFLMGARVAEATAVYEALANERGTPDVFAGLAMCRIRQGQADLAARALDRAEELGFDAAKARFLRAQILVDQGSREEAVELAREAAVAHPKPDPQAMYTLAYVLATAQHPDAETALRTYVASEPNDPDLGPLLDRSASDGRAWREHLESPQRIDP
jgi:tetratricopeptide (TPR) repeat protein